MAFPTSVSLSYGQEKEETSGQKQVLGTRATLPDGRVFRYAKNGSSAITTGGFLVDAGTTNTIAAHDMDVPAVAATAGVLAISLTVPTTAVTLNQYKDGYLIFNDGPAEGEVYRIKSNPAGDAGAAIEFTLSDGDKLRTTITTSSLAGLVENPYAAIKIADGDGAAETGVLGVTTIAVTASYYCWIQTAGIGSVAMGAQVGIVGDGLTLSQENAESGLAERTDYSDEADTIGIGVAIGIPSVAGDKQLCILNIQP